ncbi:hypothetical protein HG531_010197 [Fusarium graminearum]|nr:hypothetical protein HG531_010197 [Fusarium graminearum]
MLMVLGENTRRNNVTIPTRFTLVYPNYAYNSSCASLNGDVSSKIELAIASELEIVGSSSDASISKIKSMLAVERRARVTVWNGEFAVAETIQDTSILVADIVDNSTFSWSEPETEPPFLPFD